MPPSYHCAACGALALPINSNLVDGQRFVHRACKAEYDGPPNPLRRPLCVGSGALVEAEVVDGDRVVTCPECRRFRLTNPTDDPNWWAVEVHVRPPRYQHHRACHDEDGVLDGCVCGLDQIPVPEPTPADYGDPVFDRERPGDWFDAREDFQ